LLFSDSAQLIIKGVIYETTERANWYRSVITSGPLYYLNTLANELDMTLENARGLTPREMAREIRDTGDWGEIKQEALKSLFAYSYNQSYFDINSESIERIFSLYLGTEEIPADWPCHSSAIFTEKRSLLCMSVFGNNSPTFLPLGGKKFSLSKALEKQTLAYGLVSTVAAAEDLEKMGKDGSIHILKDLSKIKGVMFRKINGKARERLYEFLQRSFMKDHPVAQKGLVVELNESQNGDFGEFEL
jgi:hypothetical protein